MQTSFSDLHQPTGVIPHRRPPWLLSADFRQFELIRITRCMLNDCVLVHGSYPLHTYTVFLLTMTSIGKSV